MATGQNYQSPTATHIKKEEEGNPGLNRGLHKTDHGLREENQ